MSDSKKGLKRFCLNTIAEIVPPMSAQCTCMYMYNVHSTLMYCTMCIYCINVRVQCISAVKSGYSLRGLFYLDFFYQCHSINFFEGRVRCTVQLLQNVVFESL